MNKSELRKVIRLRIEALSPGSRAAKSAALCRAVAESAEWKEARTVGFFSPLPSEPNVDLLWAVLESRRVCYPRVDGGELVFIQVRDRAALLQSRWNLMEPEHRDDHAVTPGGIDLLLVPGVAFTRECARMGRGKGYYDRFLSRFASGPAPRASFGICFSEQVVPSLPIEAHDLPVTRLFSA